MVFPTLPCLIILSILPLSLSQSVSVYYTPALPAPGEHATLHCSFISNPNTTFVSALPTFFVQSITVGFTAINNNYIVNGIDLSRYRASISPGSTHQQISANLTLLNVTKADEGTLLGCSAQRTLFTSLTKFLPMDVSEPPREITTLARAPLHLTTCLTTITWDAPYSDREISSYSIFRDQVEVHTNSPSDLSYALTSVQAVGETSSYGVVPASAAGRPAGAPKVITVSIPEFQFDKGTFVVEDRSENFLNWNMTNSFPDPLVISYRLELLEGDTVKQTYSFFANTNDNRYSFSGLNGYNYVLRLSAYKMCAQSIDSSIYFNREELTVQVATFDTTIWVISGSGVLIVLLWLLGLGVLTCLCCVPRRKVLIKTSI